MAATLYISGCLSEDKREVSCPLQSSVLLFIAKYCQASTKPVLVSTDGLSSSNICSFDINSFSDTCIEFSPWENLPSFVKNVALPSVHQPDQKLVRSGLCVVLRHIIMDAHTQNPSLGLIDLLGFRQGSMKMCAEVSSWTKLCEVDIPNSVTQLIADIKRFMLDGQKDNIKKDLTIPAELMALENHFTQKCLIHNDNKRYRAEIACLKELFNTVIGETETEHTLVGSKEFLEKLNSSKVSRDKLLSLERISFGDSHLLIEGTVQLNHGVRKMKVFRNFTHSSVENNEMSKTHHVSLEDGDGEVKDRIESDKSIPEDVNLSHLKAAVMDLSYKDIQYERLYSEGIELTVADLILIAYIFHLLNATNSDTIGNLSKHLQCIWKWSLHMLSLSQVRQSAESLGWNVARLTDNDDVGVCGHLSTLRVNDSHPESRNGSGGRDDWIFNFHIPDKDENEEEIELSRCIKMKHKALKPDVLEALRKFETVGIQPVTGSHPKGNKVQVDWNNMPQGVHPKQGSVPVKRTERKCQQLENLATAVQSVAKPGDIIVDFCSGGGHLGILCAYLLPDCQVYLVENKEESLLKSSTRLQSLGLDNVVLYQCNMDYFIGQFDVGLCLHACGSATDMVLELCTKAQASFVICPCCYGSIHNTHLLDYPRSERYIQADISYTDFLTMGHAADQTEFDIKLEKQGHTCMNLVDTDRAEYARERGYDVILCSLKPLTCSPKNNLLIGTIRKEV